MKLNLPNKLTVLRLILVPIFLIVGMLPESVLPFYISCVVCAVLFIGTAVTDMLDGKIARKRGLITDFGKFLDPVADKFMVIGALFVICLKFPNLQPATSIVTLIIVFRELAVTSLRMVLSNSEGLVVAANNLGKIKTVSQIVMISTILLEPVVEYLVELIVGGAENNLVHGIYPLTWLTMIFAVVMTVWSGINYIASYWKYLDPEK